MTRTRKIIDSWHWTGPYTAEQIREAFGLAPEPELEPHPELCRACNQPVRMQIRKGTGYCCGNCEEAPF